VVALANDALVARELLADRLLAANKEEEHCDGARSKAPVVAAGEVSRGVPRRCRYFFKL
jgi:hypothetical protein